jgi:hypothetical protein
MVDILSATNEDKDKFFANFPHDSDFTLQALKGHLITEELLREMFSILLPFPDALKGANGTSFECHQVICLVEAIGPSSQDMPWAWVWGAAKKLNSIRNNLAHKLSPNGLENKVADFIECVMLHNPQIVEFQKSRKTLKRHEFALAVITLCSTLACLKATLTKDSESAASASA